MKALTKKEIDALLGLLARLTATSNHEGVRRVSNSLFTLISRVKYEEGTEIEF